MPHTCRPLHPAEPFQFQCYPGVTCFTDCCRELDLALTPYDTLRLKNRLKMHSGHFLEQYVIVEWDERQPFPLCYLTMVDDGRASCVFVREDGCSVYSDRPGSCRAYPVGRGTTRQPDGKILEQFILLTEAHCKGFAENNEQDIAGYFTNQEMTAYNRANDALLPLLQHERIQRGFKPSREQLDQYMLALYNLDTFRQEIADGRITLHRPFNPLEMQGIAGDDEHLLQLGITWLIQEFFQN
ncbi:MAG: zinc/iron-chelating domain-containing protein [Desulfobulbus propionicus]|nr:MAG: zinc/iron-chelating domain-containing protein [Desulfobulbus propionicus]